MGAYIVGGKREAYIYSWEKIAGGMKIITIHKKTRPSVAIYIAGIRGWEKREWEETH